MPLRHVVALLAVLAAATATGGALVAVLSSQPASRPASIHPVVTVPSAGPSAPATATPFAQWADSERGDDG
jgi:hypothetical protein